MHISHRRNGHRNIDEVSIPASADGLKVFGAVAASYALENEVLLMLVLSRNKDGYRCADDLFRPIAKDSLSAHVPAFGDAIEVRTCYRVTAVLDDGSEPPQFLFKGTDKPHESPCQPNIADGESTVHPALPLRGAFRDRNPVSNED